MGITPEHAEPSPPTRETDFGWWRTRTSLQVRLSWREATKRLYLFHPFDGDRDLGEFPSDDEPRRLLADLDRNRPEDFSEALFRLTGSRELPR